MAQETGTQTQFFNRELSWIEFNRRVLREAEDKSNPLLERLKFLSIVSSNFDEFFMVRVAGLKRRIAAGNDAADVSGMSPQEQLTAINQRVKETVGRMYEILNEEILPGLRSEGIALMTPQELSGAHKKYLRELFDREIFPVLTPVRQERMEGPVPYSGNMRLHAAFLLEPDDPSVEPVAYGETDRNEPPFLAVAQVPPSLDRIVWLPQTDGTVVFTFIEYVIQMFAGELFPGYHVVEDAMFRVTRDADFGVDEEREEDFVEAMEEVLESREFSQAVRLTVNKSDTRLVELLRRGFELEEGEVYYKPDPLHLGQLMPLTAISGFDHLRNERWQPVPNRHIQEDEDIWEVLKRRDVLLFHPYEQFDPVVRLVREAADDPSVLAIKMTLYRTSGTSPIVQALEQASENGKQVTVLVEIKARFDEGRNIHWAEQLQRAGAIVIYGIAQLKVHAKALLIVRREREGIRRYLHLGTGNYNERTARLYTDRGLMSSRDDLAYETGLFFNAITGYSAIPALSKLVLAPVALKPRTLQLIDREAARSTEEEPGFIMAKVNSLADPDVIEALYNASQRGVEIWLCVRGICMLVPGVPGLSESIHVISIVDRYLEHTREFYFRNGGNEEVYLASADWMQRNLERRVELMFPVEQTDLKREIKQSLRSMFKDNVKAHVLHSDGTYEQRQPGKGEQRFQFQRHCYEQAMAFSQIQEPANRKEFDVRRMP